jgi:hypothetical protein
VTSPRRPGRLTGVRAWLLALLTAVGLLVFGAGTASAHTLPDAGNRVRACAPETITAVGVSEHIAAGQDRGPPLSQPRFVVATGVAAETAARVCANSFTGDTLVLMADGTKKPIKGVKLGDKVMATDPETGEQGPRTVIDLIRHGGAHTMVAVRLTDGTTIDATDGHPFWVANRGARGGWVDAIDLRAGDQVVAGDGTRVEIAGVGVRVEDLRAFNLTVGDLHTYYVGVDEILVHNAGCVNITESGLAHSFDRHAAQWFGGQPTKASQMAEWQGLIERAAGSSKVVPWSSGGTLTNAHLARIDGKYFAAQFDRETGDLVTAFVPNSDQLGAMLRLLGH